MIDFVVSIIVVVAAAGEQVCVDRQDAAGSAPEGVGDVQVEAGKRRRARRAGRLSGAASRRPTRYRPAYNRLDARYFVHAPAA